MTIRMIERNLIHVSIFIVLNKYKKENFDLPILVDKR